MDALGHHLHEPQPVAPGHEPGQLLPPPDPHAGEGGGGGEAPPGGWGWAPGAAGVILRTRRRRPPPPPQLPPLPPPPSPPPTWPPAKAPDSRGRRMARAVSTSAVHRTPAPNRAMPMVSSAGEAPTGGLLVSGPEPPQGAPAQLGDVGHPKGGHHGHHHGDGQQGDQEPDRAPVGRPGGHPGHPERQQGHEPQPGGPVPGPLLGGCRQAAEAQPLADRGHRRLAPEGNLHRRQRPVRLGGDQLVGGPLHRVGPGRRGGPRAQPDPPPAAAGAGQQAGPEQAGDGGGGQALPPSR